MVRGRLRNLVNVALESGLELVNVAARSCRLCVRGGGRNPGTSGACRGTCAGTGPRLRGRQAVLLYLLRGHRRDRAAFSPTAPWSARSGFAARARPALRRCRPARSRWTARRCARIFPACRSRRALGCRSSITEASAARSPGLASPIATSTSTIRAPNSSPSAPSRCRQRRRSRICVRFAAVVARITAGWALRPLACPRLLRFSDFARSLEIEPERRRLPGQVAAADAFDRGDHAAVAAEQTVRERDDADIRRRGRRGAPQRLRDTRPRRAAG